MPQVLTKQKRRWANQFKPKVIRGTPLNISAGLQERYKERLVKVVEKMADQVEKELRRLFKKDHAIEFFAQDASISSQARILTNALISKFNKIFAELSKPLAEQMISEADKASSLALHSSLKDLSGGLSLKTTSLSPELVDILSASVTENVSLIKTISSKYLSGVQGAVMRSITTGGGMEDLIPYLQRSKEITKRRAKMIAYDQTRKAFNSLNKGRMDTLGIKEYEWLHSGGSNHPRKDHIRMSGNIYSLDDPPVIDQRTGERGIPGQAPNCRCRMLPVIRFNEE